ncbi:MAG: hypothetical protein A2V77_16850 [Anaeromyxobacter sp. RBG_16_69_14]|nr:MAG: hypothetical protein A2V77_16850 [Anaeromyxobacter sp. RBG_16_69_14]HJW74966.1 hypothetical protein [Thermoleophilia bacterium]
MSVGLVAPFAATILILALAVIFTRLWVNDTASRAVRELHTLGIQPGRTYKLGGAWALLAVRERRNLLWAVLAVIAWMALVVSLDLARTVGSLGIR